MFAHNIKKQLGLKLTISACVAMLGLFGCASSGEKVGPKQGNATVQVVDSAEFETLINKPGVVLIDVRTPGEFSQGHIAGAKNINFQSADFTNEIDKLDKNASFLLYCRSGSRSAMASSVMRERNFTNITHLKGGIGDWVNSGRSITAGQ